MCFWVHLIQVPSSVLFLLSQLWCPKEKKKPIYIYRERERERDRERERGQKLPSVFLDYSEWFKNLIDKKKSNRRKSNNSLTSLYLEETQENLVTFQNCWNSHLKFYLQLKTKEDVEVEVKGWDFKGEEGSCCGGGKANVW